MRSIKEEKIMYRVIIDKEFFGFREPQSKGLISGLKKLSDAGVIIEVPEFGSDRNNTLINLLKLENIKISKPKEGAEAKIFIITLRPSKEKNAVTVKKKGSVETFEEAANLILTKLRSSVRRRKTKETDIAAELSLDGKGLTKIDTGIGFFDHMLEQIAKHANINLKIKVKGDLHVDEHHTVEDVGITLGEALAEALGTKAGIKRYGYYLPMDDAIARCAVDLGGRAYLNFNCKFEREKVGGFPTELTEEFFRGLASGLKANIYIKAKAKNDHHKIESIFKAFAKSLNEACRIDKRNEGALPSTKGVL